MIEVDPLDLIPGEKYYLDRPEIKEFSDSHRYSSRGKGEFVKYEKGVFNGYLSAKFKNIKSVNKKRFLFLPDNPNKPNVSTFSVAPYKVYKFYKPLSESILARKDKETRIKAVENMINSQYPYQEDVISTSNMFSEEPYVPPSTYPPTYEETSRKTDVGHHLSSQIGKYFGGKTLKSKKSKKSKSRRRQ